MRSQRKRTGDGETVPPAHPQVAAAFPGLMAFSATMDLLTMTIQNAVPLALALGGFAPAAAIAVWMGRGAVVAAAVDASICGGLLIPRGLAPAPDTLSRLRWVARLCVPGAGAPCGALAAAGLLQFQRSRVWRTDV
jgi:Flp pilus assembly protein protease CpaA